MIIIIIMIIIIMILIIMITTIIIIMMKNNNNYNNWHAGVYSLHGIVNNKDIARHRIFSECPVSQNRFFFVV